MAYSPENNPYIPGDPACYDLKWMVQEINAAKAVREQAEGSAAAATASAEAAAASAERAGDWEADARLYAQNAETSAGNAAASAQDAGALVGPLNNRMTTIESRMDTFTLPGWVPSNPFHPIAVSQPLSIQLIPPNVTAVWVQVFLPHCLSFLDLLICLLRWGLSFPAFV